MSAATTLPAAQPAEPGPERHPTKGRCSQCGQRLQRLWLWFAERWTADRYCCPECEEKAKNKAEAEALSGQRARAARRMG